MQGYLHASNNSSLDFPSFREVIFAYCQLNRFSFDNAAIGNLMNVYKMTLHGDDIYLYDHVCGLGDVFCGVSCLFFFFLLR